MPLNSPRIPLDESGETDIVQQCLRLVTPFEERPNRFEANPQTKISLVEIDYQEENSIFINSLLPDIFKEYILRIFLVVNKILYHQELLQISKHFLRQADEFEIDGTSEYHQRVYGIIRSANLDGITSEKIWEVANICENKVRFTLYGPSSVKAPKPPKYHGVLKKIDQVLIGMTWLEHFKENLPPKYHGVKTDGKALPFFLYWYRGMARDMKPNESGRIDYVELGMTQADVRRYDPKLLRAVASAATYSGEFMLDDIVPPLFTTKSVERFEN